VENGRCCGLQVLDGERLQWLHARAVVLATGGGGHLYANTTNPAAASGDGIAMAWRAGALIRDLEFVQFHPTALMLPGAPHFLISEAVRGEGARLVDDRGDSPVAQLSGADLAPRDAVSRALVQRMRERQLGHLWLDLRPVGLPRLERQFPTILGRCRELGLEPTTAPIPVAPAAHYWMGGVRTNLEAATSLPGLYAVGEVASSGVHGANRLASNSLMECLVFARQLGRIHLEAATPPRDTREEPLTLASRHAQQRSEQALNQQRHALRQLCWQVAGVERQAGALQRAWADLRRQRAVLDGEADLQTVEQLPPGSNAVLEPQAAGWLRNAHDLRQRLLVSELLLEAAHFRQESRGGHYRLDAPAPQPYWRRHSLQQRGQRVCTEAVLS
jgi:L-aspartate oxidase